MTQSEFSYRYEFETELRQAPFQIGVRADPDLNSVDSYAAVLFFTLRDGTRVEVAKVDNSPHDEGDVHIDRFYREVGAEIKDFDIEVSDYVDAEGYLQDHGERFIRLYYDNHGLQPRGDGANV